MGAPTQTFTSTRSIEMLDQLQKLLAEMGRATVKELCDRVQLSPGQMALYVRELERTNRAHCSRATRFFQGGTTPKVWAAGPGPEGGGTAVERRIVVRKQWEPHHARDALVCFLFGAPAALAHSA